VPIPPKPSQPPKPVVPPKPTVSIKPIIPITPIVQQVRYEPQITVYNPPDQNITVNKPTDLSEVNKSLKEDKETIRSLKDIIAKLNDEMLDLTTIPAQKLPRF
jgi:hypothetical protein